ncbi:olfactory receptor 52K1-like [Phyllobates terribilis]|uniref:olfactory receptor 52K1-like n=1 Tax=Phyllobates terribilis TaxID=111132 RepID=UPI003CCAE06C
MEKECLAIVWALQHLQPYLYERQFPIETDHNPLSWLHTVSGTNGRLLRWSLALQQYNFAIHHKKGRECGAPEAQNHLHAPMYVLIAMLSAVNICSATSIVPKMLLGFLFHQNLITLAECLIQMFFIYFIILLDCNILLLMALDRYIAICKPLRYPSIMTKKNLVLLTLAAVVRGVAFVSPVIILASQVDYCRSNIIRHFACEHMALLSLACSNIAKNKLVGLRLKVFSTALDISFLRGAEEAFHIALSYMFGISSSAQRHKSLHTCETHIVVVYFSRLSSSIVYRVSRSVSQDTHNLLSAIYLLIPALVNPLIYGLRTAEIRHRLLKASIQINIGFCQIEIFILERTTTGEIKYYTVPISHINGSFISRQIIKIQCLNYDPRRGKRI